MRSILHRAATLMLAAASSYAPFALGAQARTLVEQDLKRVEDQAEAAGVPWTSGRVPVWKP